MAYGSAVLDGSLSPGGSGEVLIYVYGTGHLSWNNFYQNITLSVYDAAESTRKYGIW